MLRILYLTDIRFPLERANGIQTMETCWALASRGHHVALLVRPDVRSPARDPYRWYGLEPLPTLSIARARVVGPPALRRLCYLASAAIRVLRRGRWDLVFTRDLGIASSLLRLPRSVRPPLVYESHVFAPVMARTMDEIVSGAAPAGEAKQRRVAARERRVWLRADGYVATSQVLLSDLTRAFGSRGRVAAVPNGVRLPANRAFTPPRVSARPLVAYAGHLYPWKGGDLLVRALAEVPDARALIVGGMPGERDQSRLAALAAGLGVDGRITFTGPVEHARVPTLLADADVLVLPTAATASARHSSPLKLFEYLALGKPIVASNLPAIAEVLTDGRNGVLVDAGSPAALAAGIRRVLADADLAAGIARHAFQDAPQYSWARRAERIEELLVQVGRNRLPAVLARN